VPVTGTVIVRGGAGGLRRRASSRRSRSPAHGARQHAGHVVVGTPVTSPAPKLSVKVMGESVVWLKLLTVMVSVDVPPTGTVAEQTPW
jgi:hypothetical protein